MKIRLLVLTALVAAGLIGATSAQAHVKAACASSLTPRTEPADAVSEARDYLLYVPASYCENAQSSHPKPASLVVYLHGCTMTANDAMIGSGWNPLADREGFVVAYPQQSTTVDGNAAMCWNTGQAPLYPRGVHELETLARITRDVRDELSIPAGRVFIDGISSGALMSAAMAATYPDLYAAMGSVVGCGYPCGDPTGVGAQNRMAALPDAGHVPGFYVAGTADYLINVGVSQAGAEGWALANGGSTQPETEERGFDQQPSPGTDVCLQYAHNPCTAGALGFDDYPTTVNRYWNADHSDVVVESWLLHGMSHSYPGGDTAGTFTDPHGPGITEPMYDFFIAHARPSAPSAGRGKCHASCH